MRYVARAVGHSGVAEITYEFECADDDAAKRRGVELLEAHSTIELWKGAEHITSLTREKIEDGE